ncbi:VanZ family protein [Enterococcus faecium]|uniref:VanZ family protein n=1 Tax=Enterococcus faecium TaxID=1352 RepID=UPI00295593D4|nr:VanZ family protein [Enterococcus faecium]MDV7750018.1 VanZ family protein [Enterococcus faecium]
MSAITDLYKYDPGRLTLLVVLGIVFASGAILSVNKIRLFRVTCIHTKIGVVGCVLSVYMILVMTVLSRFDYGEYAHRILPFASYVLYAKTRSSALLIDIIENILLFMPLGISMALIGRTKLRYLIAISVAFSLFIEVIQLITRRGWFESDDIMHNLLGFLIGYTVMTFLLIKKKEKGS